MLAKNPEFLRAADETRQLGRQRPTREAAARDMAGGGVPSSEYRGGDAPDRCDEAIALPGDCRDELR